jgi:hypothetical protein
LFLLEALYFDPGTEASKMDKMCLDFIIFCARDACAAQTFHYAWMMAETWAPVIIKHFELN